MLPQEKWLKKFLELVYATSAMLFPWRCAFAGKKEANHRYVPGVIAGYSFLCTASVV